MYTYDNDEETLITINGVQYLAVPDPRINGNFCGGCAFDDPILRVLMGTHVCSQIPCSLGHRKDRKHVILKEMPDDSL